MIFEYFNPTSPSPHPLIIYFKFTWIHTLNLFIKILKGIDDGDRKDPDSLSEWIAGKSFLSNTALEWPFSSWCWPVHRRHLISPHFLHFLFIQSPSTDCMGSHPEPPLHLQPYVLATCQSWISWSTTGPYFSTFYSPEFPLFRRCLFMETNQRLPRSYFDLWERSAVWMRALLMSPCSVGLSRQITIVRAQSALLAWLQTLHFFSCNRMSV